jgi:hypothetical protein
MSGSPLADVENSSQFEFYGSHQRLFSDFFFRLDYTDQQEVCPGLECITPVVSHIKGLNKEAEIQRKHKGNTKEIQRKYKGNIKGNTESQRTNEL